ncbi:MAG: Glu/Leu/Phe/Val family dehydrogenase [Candidatus Baldrarchaeia archaeon]
MEGIKLDEIGPELVLHVYDPPTGMRGVVVIDTTVYGSAAGGIRMLPDITTSEIVDLARVMTYKFAIFNLPVGGAKGGIWAEPHIRNRDEILIAYGRAIAPLLRSGIYIPGADMGTSDKDVQLICDAAGAEEVKPRGLGLKIKEGMPLEDHLTGYGVVTACKIACEFAGIDLNGATVAIEGFGKVGGGVARYMARAGAKVVAISTIKGAIYNPNGIDVEELLEMRKRYGDDVVLAYKDAKRLEKEELFSLPVDILVPGARPYVINRSNVDKIGAKIVCPGANIPVTDEAEEILLRRGIISVPDFIANGGGIIAGVVDRLGGDEKQAFSMIESLIGSLTRRVLSEAMDKGIPPRTIAVEIARQRVLEAMRKRERKSLEELRKAVKESLGVRD